MNAKTTLGTLVQKTFKSHLSCPVCGELMSYELIDYNSKTSTVLQGEHHFYICNNCFFILNKNNTHKGNYANYIPTANISIARVGTLEKPGREFAFAQTTIKMLASKISSVLIFGAGGSLDHNHIRNLSSVNNCKITDLENYQDSEFFIPMNSSNKFDIVIASEVIEHFESPSDGLYGLLKFANDNGVIVIGTNLHVPNTSLLNLEYPYHRGHCAYWSGKSLAYLLKKKGFYVFFFNMKLGGPRKRVIFATKNFEIINKLIILSSEKQNFID